MKVPSNQNSALPTNEDSYEDYIDYPQNQAEASDSQSNPEDEVEEKRPEPITFTIPTDTTNISLEQVYFILSRLPVEQGKKAVWNLLCYALISPFDSVAFILAKACLQYAIVNNIVLEVLHKPVYQGASFTASFLANQDHAIKLSPMELPTGYFSIVHMIQQLSVGGK
ncbi:hypothetical protein M422DRAFT_55589 [Sphaerobolus stellatus SS14]|uniref:Uncharacterized protein n=1 Tax=Sphaerobolus stellatus (strain SS14) TaxID=990650 RepID=A0A0C9UM16_SPHS4|nr:hypothetical protein M422DRAFT_55589 [Sphaerobolus stellatus SS14]